MTWLLNYVLYSGVILGSVALVATGAVAAARMRLAYQAAGAAAWLALLATAMIGRVDSAVVTSMLVLGCAVSLGTLLARTAQEPGALVALAVTASIVDVTSFLFGPTHWLMTSPTGGASRMVSYLAVSISWDDHTVPVVGLGDLLLFGVFFLGLDRQGIRRMLNGGVLAGSLLLALGVGMLLGGVFGIPFMAVGVVALSLSAGRRQTLLTAEVGKKQKAETRVDTR